MPEVSVAQLAALLKVTEKAVRNAEATGRIARLPSGKFDRATAMRDFTANRKSVPGPGRTAKAGERRPVNPERIRNQESYEKFRAEKMRVIVERLKGNLVDRGGAERRIADLIVRERNAWVLLVPELAKEAAIEFGVEAAKFEIWLDGKVREHLALLKVERLTLDLETKLKAS